MTFCCSFSLHEGRTVSHAETFLILCHGLYVVKAVLQRHGRTMETSPLRLQAFSTGFHPTAPFHRGLPRRIRMRKQVCSSERLRIGGLFEKHTLAGCSVFRRLVDDIRLRYGCNNGAHHSANRRDIRPHQRDERRCVRSYGPDVRCRVGCHLKHDLRRGKPRPCAGEETSAAVHGVVVR